MLDDPDLYLRHGPSGTLLAVIVVCFSATMLMIGLVIRSLTTSTKDGVRQLALLNKTGEAMQQELREVRQEATETRHELRDSRREQAERQADLDGRLHGIEQGLDYLIRHDYERGKAEHRTGTGTDRTRR